MQQMKTENAHQEHLGITKNFRLKHAKHYVLLPVKSSFDNEIGGNDQKVMKSWHSCQRQKLQRCEDLEFPEDVDLSFEQGKLNRYAQRQ